MKRRVCWCRGRNSFDCIENYGVKLHLKFVKNFIDFILNYVPFPIYYNCLIEKNDLGFFKGEKKDFIETFAL